MSPANDQLNNDKRGTILTLRVTPRASKNEILGIMDDGTVKIHLTAPPVEGKANTALLKYLSKALDVPVASMEIITGATGRNKRIFVSNIDETILHNKILEFTRRSTS